MLFTESQMNRFLAGALLFTVTTARADFTDSFSSLDPLWIPDRYAPAGFNSSWFDGDQRLAVTISDRDSSLNRPAAYRSSIYNLQGRLRGADVIGDWSLTAQAYVGADALSGTGLRRTDLWASAGQDDPEAGTENFIIGYYHYDLSAPMDPNTGSLTSGWRIFNSKTGWVYLGAPLTLGWHGVGIYYDATANLAMYTIDGNIVFAVTPGNGYANNLLTTAVQGYNFGQAGDYTVYWDNVQALSGPLAAVPEPTSWSFALMGAGAYVFLQRSRRFVS
jgi:hypothetical protein